MFELSNNGKFFDAINTANASIFTKDLDGRIRECNKYVLNMTGLSDKDQIIGKSEYDFLSRDEADQIRKNDLFVFENGLFVGEETFTVSGGERLIYFVVKNRLHDDEGNVTGLVGTALDITLQKEAESKKIELEKQKAIANEKLQVSQIIDSVSASIYWKDLQGKMLGCNQYLLDMSGVKNKLDIIGTTDFDFLSKDDATKIAEIDQAVLADGHYEGEESFVLPSGERRIFLTVKNSLFDCDGVVVGLIGTSIDITATKEAAALRLENATIKAEAEALGIFQKEASQVAHDIRSPLSTILMTLKVCQGIPEPQRVTLRDAATRINDIANNLIGRFRKEDGHSSPTEEQRESILVSSALLEILTEKKYQYQDRDLKLNHHFSSDGNFAWIRIKPTALKRMVSNLINNAVDAFDGNPGQVTVKLDTNGEQVRMIIKDNGKGMSPQLVQKIKSKVAVSEGKSGGHGIGMTQIHDTLDENEGEMDIESIVGVGTQIILTFPCVAAQNWIADSIQLYDDDSVIVLDDDSSIHSAWDFRFEPLRKAYPNLTVIHHHKGQDTIDYFGQLSLEEKQKVFLLSDYELLQQGMNGLQVIAKVDASRSALVTSYYAHRAIQQEAAKTGTRILPKQLAAEVPIRIDRRLTVSMVASEPVTESKVIDAVFVDDDENLLSTYEYFVGDKFTVDTYHDPRVFLEKVAGYPKHTKIFLDQNYSNYDRKGEHLAEELREQGFAKLYLLTGDRALIDEMSGSLTVLIKSDLDALSAALEN